MRVVKSMNDNDIISKFIANKLKKEYNYKDKLQNTNIILYCNYYLLTPS